MAHHRRIALFSHPRTSSNLFVRLLESHPALGLKTYAFLDAYMFGPERLRTRIASGNMAAFMDKMKEKHANTTFQSRFDGLERAIADIEAQGKTVVIKEHSYHLMDPQTIFTNIAVEGEAKPRAPIVDNLLDLPEEERGKAVTATPPPFPIPNPTILPDRLFASFLPIIIIRHPCRTISSLKRALQPLGGPFPDADTVIDTSFKWQRIMYECYKAWFATPEGIEAAGGSAVAEQLPIVVDGDRLVNDAEKQMAKLCGILGLDPAGIQYTWEAQPAQDMAQIMFIGTLSKSTGIIKGKDGSDKTPVLEEEVKRWTEEWDEKTAEAMKGLVEKTINDYEFLLKRCI
ncbi:hypothetical protein E1B28_000326 [Marasmius oreades]|uniref:Sulfotransferase n=1 Tax=Marasmius oreades TaxID=181124 RepID=A0A9P8AEC3_9AGAR|nr:uncharacterized protein E1B28_000326 [Marasmius oreades]KAG7098368.1 hypothetical protein E1B28_000326 [Marasmius oreades]